jgi:hypothetical protein
VYQPSEITTVYIYLMSLWPLLIGLADMLLQRRFVWTAVPLCYVSIVVAALVAEILVPRELRVAGATTYYADQVRHPTTYLAYYYDFALIGLAPLVVVFIRWRRRVRQARLMRVSSRATISW